MEEAGRGPRAGVPRWVGRSERQLHGPSCPAVAARRPIHHSPTDRSLSRAFVRWDLPGPYPGSSPTIGAGRGGFLGSVYCNPLVLVVISVVESALVLSETSCYIIICSAPIYSAKINTVSPPPPHIIKSLYCIFN